MTSHEARNAIGYGLGVVQHERVRQVVEHGWDPENDDKYQNGELILYARYWMSAPWEASWRAGVPHTLRATTDPKYHINGTPWDDRWFKYDERTPEERLARAGALICAEIDRIKRATKRRTLHFNQPCELGDEEGHETHFKGSDILQVTVISEDEDTINFNWEGAIYREVPKALFSHEV